MKQFGDVVVYTQNGVALNALVVHSITQADVEQLTLIFLDPALQGSTIGSGQASKAFSVNPLVQDSKFGWSEYETPADPTMPPVAQSGNETNASGVDAVAAPSAADLDAVAAEQKAAEATSTASGAPDDSPATT